MTHATLAAAELMKIVGEAREAYARDVFDIAAVGALMKERAAKGHDWVQVRQSQPLRLQGTRAASKLIGWLARCECRIDWKEMPAREGDPMSPQYQYAELCIYWSKAFDQISVPAEKWLAESGHVQTGKGATRLPGEGQPATDRG